MDAPDSLCCATASSSAEATKRHHRKCDRAEKLTDPCQQPMLHGLRSAKARGSPDAGVVITCDDLWVNPTVVIVDDHPGFRSQARALLEAEGFDVVGEADDGVSALAAVNR